jgi:hypothetical protein
MLNTAFPVSAYQLRRMLRVLPRTSKKTSPSRGSGAASDADMLPIVAPIPNVCPASSEYCPGAPRVTQSRLSVMRAACRGVSPPVGTAAAGKKTHDSPGRKCHPAVRGPGARWHHSRQAFLPPPLASTVLRATPSFGEHRLFGNTVWWGRRLSCMSRPWLGCLPASNCPLTSSSRTRKTCGNSTTPCGVSPCNGSYRAG